MLSNQRPRTRGSLPSRHSPYPLGEFPAAVIRSIGQQVTHRIAIGSADITGDDFGTIFAEAIDGEHRSSPLGLADVVRNGCAWSVKTVKHNAPFVAKIVRLVSGRNSPIYSVGIENPMDDVQRTGNAVLSVWNERVDQSLDEHDELRVAVLVRNVQTRQFLIFEHDVVRFIPSDYEWSVNRRGNFEGRDRATGFHNFTWQPHGSQFTIRRQVPGSAARFSINRNIQTITMSAVLTAIGFNDSWIEIR